MRVLQTAAEGELARWSRPSVFRHVGGLEVGLPPGVLTSHVFRHVGGLEALVSSERARAAVFRHVGGLEW